MNAKPSPSRHLLLGGAVLTAGMRFIVTDAYANPAGLSVASGSASASASGARLTVTTGNPNTVLNWQSFNIAAGETTVFNMPTATSVVVNNIHGASASQIYGNLQANGLVILMNQNGFYFGPNSFVSVGGLVLTTANVTPPQNAGGSWEFNGPPPLASIVNYGQLQTAAGGSLFLIADEVDNHGTLEAPGGTVGLAAGQTVLLTERPDGRGMSMAVTLPQGSVNNYGELLADGGTLALNAQVVNQNGLLQANSVRDVNGQIELVASDAVNLGATSQISAQGDSSAGGSAGGNVTIQSGGTFSDAAGSQIVTAGGANGGNGGNVEISAPNIQSLNTAINAGAQNGATGGAFILDPENITLGTTGSTSGGTSGTINGSTGSGTLSVNVNTAFKNITSGAILLEASGNITLATAWNLSTSTTKNTGQLTLEAGQNITFNTGDSITDANSWAITLEAGYNFTSHSITSGTGNILLNGGLNSGSGTSNDGSGSIATGTGAINLLAGGAIQLGSGSVKSSGGNILWQAGEDITFYDNNSQVTDVNGGSIDLVAGYNITPANLTGGLGNIYLGTTAGTKTGFIQTDTGAITLTAGSTIEVGNGHVLSTGTPTATGDISLAAGGNVVVGTGFISTTGGGTFGTPATLGDISVTAGGNLTVGTGSITTTGGGTVGAPDATGNISLTAAQNITVGTGYVDTTGGGSISAVATAGNLVTGFDAVGYQISAGTVSTVGDAYSPAAKLGGLSTADGGDVKLTAGGSIQSYLPKLGDTSLALTAGSGAFGTAAGNVTVIAGGDVIGNYVVANGIGNIYAGVQFAGGQPVKNGITGYALNSPIAGGDAGSAGGTASGNGQLALTLISGGWNVAAAQDINLQEVRNPNGDFDEAGGPAYALKNLFNYSANSFVNLSAGNEVQLGAEANMPSAALNPAMEVIYPPILNITAGAGGVVLGASSAPASLTLYPSPDGSLTIDTTGPLLSNVGTGEQFALTVSDAPSLPFSQFSQITDAATPVHLAKSTPIYLNIGGDMDLINLTVPEAAYVQVGGNLIDSSFQGMNLSLAAGSSTPVTEANGATLNVQVTPGVTTINVAGDILYPSSYDPANGTLTTTYSGLSLAGGGTFNITARTIDLGTGGGIESEGAAYNQSEGYPLAQLFGVGGAFTKGADIVLTTTGNHTEPETLNGNLAGDLDMTLSSIDSLFGGGITINSSADLNVGAAGLVVNNQSARGIYTSSGGDLDITANGNIEVNGSRITTFDGGNITVESLNGNINAGSGSSSPVSVTGYYETTTAKVTTTTTTTTDSITVTTTTESLATGVSTTTTTTTPTVNGTPGTATVTSYDYNIATDSPQIPFSGIAALTFPDRAKDNYPAPPATIGNVLVEAPNGTAGIEYTIPNDPSSPVVPGSSSIYASSAGILQLPENYLNYPDAQVVVLAGYEMRDSSGNRVTAANLAAGSPVLVTPDEWISVGGSGVVASNAKLEASGGIQGLIFAFNNIDIVAQQNVNVTALGEGNVNVSSANGSISGTIIGVGSVSVSGDSVDASLISASVSGSSSGQTGLGTGNAAAGTATAAASDETTKANTAATLSNNTEDSDDKKKKGKHIGLAQKVSRVTVLLPGKN